MVFVLLSPGPTRYLTPASLHYARPRPCVAIRLGCCDCRSFALSNHSLRPLVVDSLSSLDTIVSLLGCLLLLHSTALLQNCAYSQGHVGQYRTYMANYIYRGVIPRVRVLLFGVRVTAVCHGVCACGYVFVTEGVCADC